MIETYKYLHGIYKVDTMPLELDHVTARDCKTTKELLKTQGSEPVEHPHSSFSTLIEYIQIQTNSGALTVLNKTTTCHPCPQTIGSTS